MGQQEQEGYSLLCYRAMDEMIWLYISSNDHCLRFSTTLHGYGTDAELSSKVC